MGSVHPETPIFFADPKSRKVLWESHPGPQSRALRHRAFEVLYGGARGGGKTFALIVWFALGNPDLSEDHPCRYSYLNHPKFRGLVLRRNASDLKDFVNEAFSLYRHLGAKKKDDPAEFHFPSGAIIYCNHLDSKDAFEKYKGWNLTKLGIEELTLIEDPDAYLSVLGSVRSPDPSIMRAQVFCTTNPDGNGSPWVRKRFVHVLDGQGHAVPWGKTMRDPFSQLTRVFIPAKLTDNPSLGPEYLATLRAQGEKKRRAWIDGDWYALTGLYFSEFRPNGPLEASFPPEPEWARHVIKQGSVPLLPWWQRYIGCDWGFKDNAAAVWLSSNEQDRRLHCYDELVVNQVGSEHLGVMIAQKTMPDLIRQPDLQIPLYLSHDAFAVRDVSKTTAELIQKGIEAGLGIPGSVAVATAGEGDIDPDVVDLPSVDESACIVIHKAGRERVSVWQHIRSLLRFEPMMDLGEPNAEYAQKLLAMDNGILKYETYMQAYQKKKEEVLPGIQIWDNCTQLIEEMSSAIHDDKKPEDLLDVRQGSSHMDALQALRHCIMMLMRERTHIPFRHFMAQRMNVAVSRYSDPTILAQIARKAQADYQKTTPVVAGRFARASSRQRVM